MKDTAHEAAQAWACWVLAGEPACDAIGYPTASPEARAGRGGRAGKPGSRVPSRMTSRGVLAVDRAVKAMRVTDPHLAEVLVLDYLYGRRLTSTQRSHKAEALRIIQGFLMGVG